MLTFIFRFIRCHLHGVVFETQKNKPRKNSETAKWEIKRCHCCNIKRVFNSPQLKMTQFRQINLVLYLWTVISLVHLLSAPHTHSHTQNINDIWYCWSWIRTALFIPPSPLKITGVSTGRRDRARVIFKLKAEKLIRAVSHTQNSQILRTKRQLTERISKKIKILIFWKVNKQNQ